MTVKRARPIRRRRAVALRQKGRLSPRIETSKLSGAGNVASWGNHVKNRRREVGGMDVVNVAQPAKLLKKTSKIR